VAKGAIAMQIAPTIRLIDTRFDIQISPILKNRSQGMLDRFARYFCPASPMATSLPDSVEAGGIWSRSTLQGRSTIGPVSSTNRNECPCEQSSVARRAAREWFVC
jgi:hypothetical protein